jgi:hypothetical protein
MVTPALYAGTISMPTSLWPFCMVLSIRPAPSKRLRRSMRLRLSFIRLFIWRNVCTVLAIFLSTSLLR